VLTGVRPAVLRRYYEATYGNELDRPAAYAGATREEFFTLARIRHPGESEWSLARYAPPELGLMAVRDQLDATKKAAAAPRACTLVQRRPRVDLGTVAIDSDPPCLSLDAIKAVEGWDRLGERKLDRLLCSACASEETFGGRPSPITALQLIACDQGCVRAALAALQPEKLQVESQVPFTLTGDCARARVLTVMAPFANITEALDQARLEALTAAYVNADDPLWEALGRSGGTLRLLTVASAVPFGPERLAAFTRLERVWIAALPEGRAAWIDWAVAHPTVPVIFDFPDRWQLGSPTVIAEVYRGVPIMKAAAGRRTRFEIASDLVDLLGLDLESDEELEDRLKPLARKAGKKVRWNSEADTLIASGDDLDAVRWVIDTAAQVK
jgi:hypothetical protein